MLNLFQKTLKFWVRTFKLKEVAIDLSRHGIGEVHFEGYIFDLDNKILSFGLETPQTLKSYLSENGGIRIYRDKMRINSIGEQESRLAQSRHKEGKHTYQKN